MKHEKSCGALVFRCDRQVSGGNRLMLLVIRPYGGGGLAFPKGHVEAGETEKETAVREVFEETAVAIEIEKDFRETVSYSPARGVKKEVVYFIAETDVKTAVPRHGEIADAFFTDVETAFRGLEHDNDKSVLEKALAYLEVTDEKGSHI